MELEGVFFGGEVERPEDVYDREEEPACGHGVEGGLGGEDPLVDADDGEDDRDGAEYGNLEAVHGDSVAREGVEDTKDEEELEEDGEPEHADCAMSDCICTRQTTTTDDDRSDVGHAQ